VARGFTTVSYEALAEDGPGADLIRNIAFELTENRKGLEQDVLRKSIQELLLQIAGTNPDIKAQETARRLTAYLRRHREPNLLRRFLSIHLFNVVWFNSSEGFRLKAWTPNSFVDDMNSVENDCRRIVNAIWKSQKMSVPFNSASAQELVNQLEQRLMRQ
jgi:hypothetical protein